MSDAYKGPAQGRAGDAGAQISGHEDAERVKRLSDKLAAFFADTADADMDKLDGILSALKEASPLPEGGAFDAEQGLRRFHERLAAQEAAKQTRTADDGIISSSIRRSKKHRLFKHLLIAAVLALALATSVQGFHLRFFDLIAQWSSEVFGFKRQAVEYAEITKRPNLALNETREYDSVQALLDDFGITAPLFPTWVPERFGEPTVMAGYTDESTYFQIDYREEKQHLHIRVYEIMPDLHQTEKDEYSAESEWIHGTNFFYMSDNLDGSEDNIEKVVWQNGNFECIIFGSASKDELQKMIYSIYER